jgi:hypothetical protein
MVERSIAWLTRGQRQVPYRGVIKNDAWLHLRVAAINLRRLLTLGLTGTPALGAGLLTITTHRTTVNAGQGDLSVAPSGADLTAARLPRGALPLFSRLLGTDVRLLAAELLLPDALLGGSRLAERE